MINSLLCVTAGREKRIIGTLLLFAQSRLTISECERVSLSFIMLWANFLEQIPPGSTQDIEDLFKNDTGEINSSDIQLHCESDKCKGVRFFNPIHTPTIKAKYYEDVFVTYGCATANTIQNYFLYESHRRLGKRWYRSLQELILFRLNSLLKNSGGPTLMSRSLKATLSRESAASRC